MRRNISQHSEETWKGRRLWDQFWGQLINIVVHFCSTQRKEGPLAWARGAEQLWIPQGADDVWSGSCLWVNRNRAGTQRGKWKGQREQMRGKSGRSGAIVLHEHERVFIFSLYTVVTPPNIGHFSHLSYLWWHTRQLGWCKSYFGPLFS